MNNLLGFIKQSERFLRNNSPVILTAMGVGGTVSTAYLAAKAAYVSALTIQAEEEDRGLTGRDKFELVWTLYIPPVISGGITIGCIIGATRISSKRVAAAYSLIAVAEKSLEEYREKVVEHIGERKEQAVRDEIAQDRVTASPPGTVIFESGEVLCYEMLTGRYFTSSMEKLRRSANEINAKINQWGFATLEDFYYLAGLDFTSQSHILGWDSGRLLELEFSSTVANDNTPCLVMSYNYTKPI